MNESTTILTNWWGDLAQSGRSCTPQNPTHCEVWYYIDPCKKGFLSQVYACHSASGVTHRMNLVYVFQLRREDWSNNFSFLYSAFVVDDIGSIFEEHRICNNINLYQILQTVEGEGVFVSDENKFIFTNVLVGHQATARFKISNVGKIPCDAFLAVKPISSKVSISGWNYHYSLTSHWSPHPHISPRPLKQAEQNALCFWDLLFPLAWSGPVHGNRMSLLPLQFPSNIRLLLKMIPCYQVPTDQALCATPCWLELDWSTISRASVIGMLCHQMALISNHVLGGREERTPMEFLSSTVVQKRNVPSLPHSLKHSIERAPQVLLGQLLLVIPLSTAKPPSLWQVSPLLVGLP